MWLGYLFSTSFFFICILDSKCCKGNDVSICGIKKKERFFKIYKYAKLLCAVLRAFALETKLLDLAVSQLSWRRVIISTRET